METLIVVGAFLAVVGILVFFLRRSAKNEGWLENESKSQQEVLDIRKETNEFKRKTKGSSRRDFLDMGK